MNNIYKQIDIIFSGEAEEKPQWAKELLQEIQEVRILLQEQKELLNQKQAYTYTPQNKHHIDSSYYDFIKQFRISMKADVDNDIYPTFEYLGRRLGVDYSGLLYDKKDSKILSKQEAFKVYRYAYEHSQKRKNSA